MFAVIQVSGHQYKVSPKDVLIVDRLDKKEGEKVILSKTLLYSDGETVLVGKPYIPAVSVVVTIKNHKKGNKIRVARFKAKSRYRKVTGFRPSQTEIVVEEIKTDNKSK